MNPILYSQDERQFKNNGIGILADAISCTAAWSGNGIFDLTMEYPMDGMYFSEITDNRIIYATPTPYDKPQPYKIKQITKRMDGIAEVYAQHVAYDLAGTPILPFKASGIIEAFLGFKKNAAVQTEFTFTTDKTTAANFAVTVPTPAWNLLGGQTGSILDVYGGEYYFDHWNVKLYNQLGQDNGVVIRYGKNLKDLEQERNLASVYTGVLGYWSDIDGNIVYSEPKVVSADGNFGYTKILTLDLSSEWENAPTPEQVKTRVEQYIKANKIGEPTVSLTVSHELLEQTDEYAGFKMLEELRVFDTVTVQFEKLGINVKAKVVETVTDVLNDRYLSVKIGSVKANITDTIIKQEQEIQKRPTTTELEKAVNNATEWITSGGGYIVAIKDENGNWKELVSLDKNNLQEAKNVWRWNNGGFGFSPNGYNGPYKVAITQDGHFVADFITTGTLVANIIKAGVLQSNDGETFFLDIENGILKMKATEFSIAGKTVEQIAQEKADAAQSAASKELQDYASAVTKDLENLQGQIDGQIQSWFYNYVPTANNAPASEWTTTDEKNKHLGDLFYIVDNTVQGGQAYRWALVNGVYKWVLIEDAEVTKALADAAKAQDTADSKRRVFVSTPVPPYDIGDLWAQGTNGDLMRCAVSRQSGGYVSSDWVKASKYTDNTALTEFVNGTYKTTIEQLKQQSDQKAETWYQSEDPSLSWSASEKPEHSGDIWYNTSGQQSFIYNGTAWQEMKTTPPESVFDKIDGKAQVFVSQPVPPYDIGDLWTQGANGDLMRCKTARQSGSYAAADWEKATKYTDNTALVEFINGDFAETVKDIQDSVDGKAETWYQASDPSTGWTDKNAHKGDIWYNTSAQKSYRWTGTAWEELKTTPPDAVFDKIDGKAQVFVSQPVPPYSVGDLWTDSSTGDLRRCKTSRQSGAFNASDWVLATDYVTSSDAADIASGAVSAQTQLDIFNKLTNNGALQGLYMQDGKLYINAEYLGAQTISSTNGNLKIDLSTGRITAKTGNGSSLSTSTSGQTYSNSDGHLGSTFISSGGYSVCNFAMYRLHYPNATQTGAAYEGETVLYWYENGEEKRKIFSVDDVYTKNVYASETIRATKFGPTGKNVLTLDWVLVNKADGTGTVCALCGF